MAWAAKLESVPIFSPLRRGGRPGSRGVPSVAMKKRISLLCLFFLLPSFLACQSDAERSMDRAASTARAVLAQDGIDPFDRITAAGVLMSGGSEEANEVIIDALTSGAQLAQQAAVGALLGVPGDHAIRRIESYAEQADANLHAVLQAMRWAPRTGARGFVLQGLRHNQPGTLVAAFDAAALLNSDQELLSGVEEAVLQAREEHVRGYGVYAAAALGSPNALSLIDPLVRGTVFEREIAAASLGFIQNEESRAALDALVEDSQLGVRISAWASLSQFGHEDAADRLYAALAQPDSQLASLAAGALRRASADTLEEVSARAGNWSEINVYAAGRVIEAIGWSSSANASAALASALESDTDELLKLQSLWAVGWRGREEERAMATAHLDDASVAVRTMAAWATVRNQQGGREGLLHN